jgi:nicotinamidase-related amidase
MTISSDFQTGLIDHEDTILVIIDFQDGFLRKLDADRAALIVDNSRFIVEVSRQLNIPTFVTVESPVKNGRTSQTILSRLPADTEEREKIIFGMCGQPNLREAISAQARRTAVLIGMETDVCILHSAVGLREAGFRPIIVSDATAAPGDEHALGLKRAERLGIEVLHTKGLYYEWIRSLAGFAAVARDGPIAPPMGSRL